MFRILILLVLLFALPVAGKCQKQRLLITTDIGGDPDDQQSLIRLMVYSNEFEIEGIVCSASGTPGELKNAIVRPDLVEEIILAYKQVYPRLVMHDDDFIRPEILLSFIKKGNPNRGYSFIGPGQDTEGSNHIIYSIDKSDPRPLNICIFGGQTDLAQALWKVKNNRSPKEYQRFISKIRVYDINDQDKIFEGLIAEHPGLFYILAKAPKDADKREGAYRGVYLGGDESLTSKEWISQNVSTNHGPLGELYPQKTWTAPNPHGVMKEGDTPSWFYFLDNGLNVQDHPEFGGWGGRFTMNKDGWYSDATDSFQNVHNARATVYRWRADFQNDFAARMDWCVNEYSDCNHPPVIVLNGKSGKDPFELHSRKGKTVTFNAGGTTDPEGHELSYEWLVYPEAGNTSIYPEITSTGTTASLIMPELAKGQQIHIILCVKDKGNPSLTAYRRIILR